MKKLKRSVKIGVMLLANSCTFKIQQTRSNTGYCLEFMST